MPGGRPRHGGKRSGTIGKAYANRSDLNGPAPISAAGGQPYGERGAQEAAQRAVPMGTPQVPPPGPGGGPGGGPAPQFTGRPEAMAAPGSLGDLFADSTNPGEHVMNGSALGPGAGPEAFGLDPATQSREDLVNLAQYLPALEMIANRPDASPATRRMVRQMKAKISLLPPGRV